MRNIGNWLICACAVAVLIFAAPGCSDDNTNPDGDTSPDAVADTTPTDTTPTDTTPTDTTPTDTADTTDTDTVDPRVAACSAAIATKEATVSGQLAGWSIADPTEMVAAAGGNQKTEADYAGKYRDDLANHPGCAPRTEYGKNVEAFVSDNEAAVPAGTPASGTSIPGYACAAKVYDTAKVDTTKPIVILVHGNSSSITSFEEYSNATLAGTTINSVAGFAVVVDSAVRAQLATKLLDAGYEVISFDARIDLVNTLTDYDAASATGNPFRNIDHGWAVPMLQSLIKSVMVANPTREVSVVGHSLGVTVIRDALRRLYVESAAGTAGSVNPFAKLQDVVLLSGANHGVSNGKLLCDSFPHMKGKVGCEMGDRAAFVPTYFSKALNGPADLFATPCADGSYAFGERDKCDGNVVEYTTVTMADLADGSLQDEFVSETSSSLALDPCVTNELLTLADYDTSAYFFTGAPGFFANHFGSARSDAGMALILSKLGD